MKTRSRRQLSVAPVTPKAEGLLSPARAFVVQFREEPKAGRGGFTGRVEHMVSGRATRFHSPEELLAFFAQVLSAVHGDGSVACWGENNFGESTAPAEIFTQVSAGNIGVHPLGSAR